MKIIIEDLKYILIGYEMSFSDLDRYMEMEGFDSKLDEDIEDFEDFIEEEKIIYFHKEGQVEVIFKVTYEASENESITSTYIKIEKIREY